MLPGPQHLYGFDDLGAAGQFQQLLESRSSAPFPEELHVAGRWDQDRANGWVLRDRGVPQGAGHRDRHGNGSTLGGLPRIGPAARPARRVVYSHFVLGSWHFGSFWNLLG